MARPGAAFEPWKRCSAGQPCDYTGLTYAKLRGDSGIQGPCTDQAPDDTERLYIGGITWEAPELCECYGKDLVTGASVSETEYRALNSAGKAVLKAANYLLSQEDTSDAYPLQLSTGRSLHHFRTCTKTGRTPSSTKPTQGVGGALRHRGGRTRSRRGGSGRGDHWQVVSAAGR